MFTIFFLLLFFVFVFYGRKTRDDTKQIQSSTIQNIYNQTDSNKKKIAILRDFTFRDVLFVVMLLKIRIVMLAYIIGEKKATKTAI